MKKNLNNKKNNTFTLKVSQLISLSVFEIRVLLVLILHSDVRINSQIAIKNGYQGAYVLGSQQVKLSTFIRNLTPLVWILCSSNGRNLSET